MISPDREALLCLCPASGGKAPPPEVPLHLLTPEPDHVGQDTGAITDPTGEFIFTEVAPKAGEMLHQRQTSRPLMQSPTLHSNEEPVMMGDLLVASSSKHEDTSEGTEKAIYPDFNQPAPEKDSQTDNREAGVLPTASLATEGTAIVVGGADAPMLETGESPSDRDMSPEEGGDHTPGLEHLSCGCVDKISAVTTEGAHIHSTTMVPSSQSRRTNPTLDQDSVGLDTSEVTSDSGESEIKVPDRTVDN